MGTKFEKIKEKSKMLFDVISIQDASDYIGMDGLIISHPFLESAFVPLKVNGEVKLVNLLEDEDYQNKIRSQIFDRIDTAQNLIQLMLLVNKPYRLYWFTLIKWYCSKEDYATLLREVWIISENPNDDKNVPLNTCIKSFQAADKKLLMEKEDYKFYESLPDSIKVYRGVSRGRNPYGLSYTIDKDKALWFQSRFASEEEPGFLIELTVDKKDVLAYINSRDEKEIVLNTNHYKNEIKEQCS